MSKQFYDILTSLLSHQQLSISSIARELKKNGYGEHRLILTGYLRALHDTGYLDEVDIPPAKVYIFKSNQKGDIYSIVRDHLRHIDISERLPLSVYILSSLFHRPCFKHELELLGIEARKTAYVKESKDIRLKEHRAAVTRIKIPQDDPAYEIGDADVNMQSKGNEILAEIINELMDLDGLKAKFQQTKLS